MRSLPIVDQSLVFDHRLADCHTCELFKRRDETFCPSQKPSKTFNGLMIVGEGPGSNESRLKIPFVGPAGNLLDKILKQAGLEREECYIANATRCFPPFRESKKNLDEDFPNVVPSCLPILDTEIFHYRPRVIVALGRPALLALTGKSHSKEKRIPLECGTCKGSLTVKWWKCPSCKGPIYLGEWGQPGLCETCDITVVQGTPPEKRNKKCPECNGRKTKVETVTYFKTEHKIDFVAGAVFRAQQLGFPEGVEYIIPSYHPSRVIRKAETEAQAKSGGQFLAAALLEHFKKARRLLERDAVWEVRHTVTKDVDVLDAYLERNKHAAFVELDIETDNKEPTSVTDIRCIGLHAADAIDDETLVVNTSGLPKEHPLIQRLIRFLADSSIRKGGQNGADYDCMTMWLLWGVETRGYDRDTLIAHNSVAPDEAHDLHHIAFLYTESPPWKPPKGEDGAHALETDEELHLYNARDAKNQYLSQRALEREMASERTEFVHKLDVMKMHIARQMNKTGIPIDKDLHAEWKEKIGKNEVVALALLREIAGNPEFNPDSPAQLSKLLYDPRGPCKLIPAAFTDKGQPSTNATALMKLRQKQPHQVIEALADYREWNQLNKMYFGESMAIDSDWRLRVRWNPIAARTGRWASSPNLTNWPDVLTEIIKARKGRKIVGADLPAAELRIGGGLANDEVLIAKCINADDNRKLEPEWDPHSYTSSYAFPSFIHLDLNDPVQKKTRKDMREVGKTVSYALFYAGGDEAILEGIYKKGKKYKGPPVSLEMVAAVRRGFFTAYQGVAQYTQRVVREAGRTGYLKDVLIGRLRCFPMRDVPYTEASNFAIQSTCASMMDMALVEIMYQLADIDPTAFPLIQQHDALYFECAEDKAHLVADLVSNTMGQEVQFVPGGRFMPFPVKAVIADSVKDAH